MGVFMQELRKAIMPIHDEAEKNGPLRQVVEKNVTLENYRMTLLRIHGFVSELEKAVDEVPGQYRSELDWDIRKRSGMLEKDLLFLGETTLKIRTSSKFDFKSQVRTVPQALGLIYLMEGSRLGGLVLAKALREHFGFSNFNGYSYFASPGIEVVPMWQSFTAFMENFVAVNGHGPVIIISAKNGFEALNTWLAES